MVAINHFASDKEKEIEELVKLCRKDGFNFAFLDGYLKGGEGSIELAKKVKEVLDTKKSELKYLYDVNSSIEEKINIISKEIYHAKDVIYTKKSLDSIQNIKKLGCENLPICMAKTQSSFSDNPKLLNVPRNFNITISDVSLSNGAGFIVCYCGNILTMPGLPKVPLAMKM